MDRHPESEFMDDPAEALAYARADFDAVNQAFVERMLCVAGPRGRAATLDLGTGPGDIPIRVIHARPDWHVAAVDASEAMIELARAAIHRAGLDGCIQPVLADAKATGLPRAAFDVIFSNSILHHVTRVDLLWAEVKRLAAPGAAVFLRDLARPESPEAAWAIVRRYTANESDLLQQEFYRSLLSAYTVDEVRVQLDHSGLQTLQVAMVTDRHLDVFGRLD